MSGRAVEEPGAWDLASPRQAEIIRVTRAVRRSLPMIQASRMARTIIVTPCALSPARRADNPTVARRLTSFTAPSPGRTAAPHRSQRVDVNSAYAP